ncbi:MAG: hypothetical protein ABIN48_08335, partial [Ginsengibacter sp.]
MNINLDNYEEYFLLYADNELSQEERIEVEEFVQKNPHLKEEFDLTNMTLVEPEESLVLTDKSFLLKSTDTEFINEHNYAEIFVLYHDSELEEKQQSSTLEFLKKHPEFEDEFSLIGQAKIHADSVSYPNKKLLLRKEPSGIPGRIIFFRSMAAAVILGFGLWFIFSQSIENSSRNPIAQQKTNVTDGLKNEQRNEIKISPNQQVANLDTHSENIKEGLVNETKPKTIQRAGIVEKDRNENQVIAKHSTHPSDAMVIEDVSAVDKSTKKKEQNNTELIAQIPQKKNVETGIISSSDLRNIDLDLTPEILGKAPKEANYVHLDVDKAPSS